MISHLARGRLSLLLPSKPKKKPELKPYVKEEMGSKPQSPDSVDEALDRFWLDRAIRGQHVPDYAGFSSWVAKKMEAARAEGALPIHAHAQPLLAQLAWDMVEAAKLGGITFTKSGASPDAERFGKPAPGQSALKSWNRAKLLLSFFNDLPPRMLEMYLMMSRGDDPGVLVDANSTQSEHRAAFFRAIAIGDQHLAFKMVGRLREEAHDVGELAFLEATASFHANRFEEAIQHACRVSKDAIDWPRAFMLILESHAYRGDISALSAEIEREPDFKPPRYFIQYLCEVAIENSGTPREAFRASTVLIEEVASRVEQGSGVFVLWNRHSCQLAVRLVEFLQGSAQVPPAGFEDSWDEYPLPARQLACALAVDASLLAGILGSPAEQAYKEIVKRLVNHTLAGPEDYLIALTAQWRIGDRAVFLDNIVANLDVLLACDMPERVQLLGWAYQAALILKRPSDASLVKQRLLATPGVADRLAKAEADANTAGREEQLSQMGRLALRSAYWDLQQAEADDHLWRDAGMLSLGFFRILELEFNERLILPMMRSVDFRSLEDEFKKLDASETGGSGKKAVEFWKRLLPALRRALIEQKGLELGALELILRKLTEVSGADAPLKKVLHAALVASLSDEGVNALRSGQMADLVSESPRERFRNPPAHARYVSLSTARACMEYVERALDHLATWTAGCPHETVTVH